MLIVNIINFSLGNFRFVKITSYPAVGEQLTAKYYVDEAIPKA